MLLLCKKEGKIRKKTKLKGNIYLQKYTTKRLIYYTRPPDLPLEKSVYRSGSNS